MALVLVLLFLVVPIAELAVIVQVAGVVGVPNTIGLLIVVSILGAWLAKREGLNILRRIQQSLARGELPSRQVADGGLILLAGALMITPGFLTDCLALMLLIPPTRAMVRRVLLARITNRARVRVYSSAGANYRGGASTAGDDGIWDVDSWEAPYRRVGGELDDHHD